jgi:hypothetical protein
LKYKRELTPLGGDIRKIAQNALIALPDQKTREETWSRECFLKRTIDWIY